MIYYNVHTAVFLIIENSFALPSLYPKQGNKSQTRKVESSSHCRWGYLCCLSAWCLQAGVWAKACQRCSPGTCGVIQIGDPQSGLSLQGPSMMDALPNSASMTDTRPVSQRATPEDVPPAARSSPTSFHSPEGRSSQDPVTFPGALLWTIEPSTCQTKDNSIEASAEKVGYFNNWVRNPI